MDNLAVFLGIAGYLVFGFVLTVALARLALAMAELADRLGPHTDDEKRDRSGRPDAS